MSSRRFAADHLRGRLARFAGVGLSGVVINMAVLVTLAEVAGWQPEIAAVIATESAILSNFTLNDRWTFGDARPGHSWPARALRYNMVAIGGLVITVTVLAILVNIGGMHYVPANLVAIGSATGWNYFVSGALTWSMWGGGLAARFSASRIALLRGIAAQLWGGG